jgi:hypothetical protein
MKLTATSNLLHMLMSGTIPLHLHIPSWHAHIRHGIYEDSVLIPEQCNPQPPYCENLETHKLRIYQLQLEVTGL